MARRPQVSASEQQLAELKELARSERRDEADRARAEAPGQAKKVAMMGALDAVTHELMFTPPEPNAALTSWRSWIRSTAVLARSPAGPGSSSTMTRSTPAGWLLRLAARPWITVEWLPKYAPELNDIELAWRDLKRHFLAHRTFTDADHLEATIHCSVSDMNRERGRTLSCDSLRISA
jgi:DDE superfamily endonuclease